MEFDSNLVFVMGYGLLAIMLIGLVVVFSRFMNHLSANTQPEVTIAFANSIKEVADSIILAAEKRAKETPTPIDDIGVAVIRIPYGELIKHLPIDMEQPTPPSEPLATADGEISPGN